MLKARQSQKLEFSDFRPLNVPERCGVMQSTVLFMFVYILYFVTVYVLRFDGDNNSRPVSLQLLIHLDQYINKLASFSYDERPS